MFLSNTTIDPVTVGRNGVRGSRYAVITQHVRVLKRLQCPFAGKPIERPNDHYVKLKDPLTGQERRRRMQERLRMSERIRVGLDRVKATGTTRSGNPRAIPTAGRAPSSAETW